MIAWALQQRGRAAGGVRRRRNGLGRHHRRAVRRQRASGPKSCTPGYYNREGQANAKTRQGSFFYGSPTEYADILAASRCQRRTGGLRNVVTKRYLLGRIMALTRRRPSPEGSRSSGPGFGGLAAAVALRRRGIDDLTIIERADGVGGTWRRNVYPGAACDIQSHLYSFSFAPNRAWSRTYAYQPEILDYLETVADDFDLRRHLMLSTGVRSMDGMRRRRTGTWTSTSRRRRGRRCRGERRRAVRLRSLPRYRRPRRLRRHAHAHRALGCDRRPEPASGWR